MTTPLADLRRNYTRGTLDVTEVAADPLAQFGHWFEEAVAAQVPEPNAMTLATVAPDGRPQARVMLLKACDAEGFTFFTNYGSHKAAALAAHPQAALCFWWIELERQVRVEGRIESLPRADSAAYFAVRPRDSQIGAWASRQSQPVADRAALEAQFAEQAARWDGREVELPQHWGGYRLHPGRVEFWQGRPGRMHDRIVYVRTGDAWQIGRLQP